MAIALAGTTDSQIDYGNRDFMDGATALTVMFWIKTSSISANDSIFGSGQMTMYVVNATTDWRMSTNANNFTGLAAPSAGVWTHLAVVYNGAETGADRLKVFYDAVQQSTTPNVAPPTALSTSAVPLELGGDLNSGGVFAGMDVAHWRVYTAALTPVELSQEMNSYRPVRTSNLQIWSPLDDGTSTRDYSGLGQHGTAGANSSQVTGPPISYGG